MTPKQIATAEAATREFEAKHKKALGRWSLAAIAASDKYHETLKARVGGENAKAMGRLRYDWRCECLEDDYSEDSFP